MDAVPLLLQSSLLRFIYFHTFCESKIALMAKTYPFRALRYDPSKVKISDVVIQPYDKISPAMQDRYYKSSPYNLVRVILGKPEAGDNDQQNVYTRAAANLERWRSEGVVVADADPSIYRYTQT